MGNFSEQVWGDSHERGQLCALKVGVTKELQSRRLNEHEADGWVVERTWCFEVGFDALDVEEMVLDQWRNLLHMPQQVSSRQMPQGGFSETAPYSTALLAETIEIVDSWIAHLEASRLTESTTPIAWSVNNSVIALDE